MLPEQKKAFDKFYSTARHNKVLDNRTSLMVHLGAAMALGCYPCMQYYLDQVDNVGLTDDEISAVESIVMAVAAGKVKQQFNEVLSKGSGSGCVGDDDSCK